MDPGARARSLTTPASWPTAPLATAPEGPIHIDTGTSEARISEASSRMRSSSTTARELSSWNTSPSEPRSEAVCMERSMKSAMMGSRYPDTSTTSKTPDSAAAAAYA